MTPPKPKTVVPIAYQRQEAAFALGLSPNQFDKVRDELPSYLVGGTKFFPVWGLDEWTRRQVARSPAATIRRKRKGRADGP
ncbi:hypothetical protein [Conexibacter sp. CPCC 206217]|uniref:hypothetical protein n=1 Tax=Conexibacter sp. CPCC 206217 TaxID=3064574 RepID=UPI00271E1A64|nr:hypothetical protein [Conexibacter sp. CPCC 206217]MDO8213539.1 hypothetical protein [Conexibacter sp. CPCC 206217]